MSATKALSGFKPSRIRGSGSNATGTNEYRVSTGYAANIFYGDLVRNVAGYVQVITSLTDMTLGVAQGVRYTQDGKPVWSKYWPSGTSASDIWMTVVDDPSATFVVQANASVSIGDLNSQNFDVTLGAGSTFTGNSGFGVKASSRKTTPGMVRPISAYNIPGNSVNVAATMAYPVLEVRLIQDGSTAYSIVTSVSALNISVN
jgi:hypothetical protein